jgi:hypothetical protein
MSHPATTRPDSSEYAADFAKYIQLVPAGDIQAFLATQLADLLALLSGLSDEQSLVHHAPYTWSFKQVVGHVTDCERIFGYRALRIARGDATPLASFDENAYMQMSNFDRCPFIELLDEFANVRRSHLAMFKHLEAEAWLRRGVVRDHPATTRAFAYAIAGHAKHHLDILHRRLAVG